MFILIMFRNKHFSLSSIVKYKQIGMKIHLKDGHFH